MKKVYLANGLFSMADFKFNELIAKTLRENIKDLDLFVPQEQEINDKNSYADSEKIFELDYENVIKSDLMVAVIDGVEIDSGVACEIGIARSLNIPIVALYTDMRLQGTSNTKKINALIDDSVENQFMYRNLFVIGAVKSNGSVVSNLEKMVKEVNRLLS